MARHVLRVVGDQRLCELPVGFELLDVGFVKIAVTDDLVPCRACLIVLDQANEALRNVSG